MQKTAFLFVLVACLLSPAREPQSSTHRVPARVGLVLIAAAQDGLALAADGSSLNADGRVSQEQKLFQLGKQGALALTGAVSIQDPVGGRVRGEINVARIAAAWVAAHGDADLETANREVNATIAAEFNKFLSARDPGAAAGTVKFRVMAAGYSAGKPSLIVTTYFMPGTKGKPARTVQTSVAPKPGDLWIFGSSAAPAEILSGKNAAFRTFREEPGVARFHSAQKSSLTAPDYVGLFQAMLQAAESAEGRKLDGKLAIVAAPNQFATVTPNAGYISAH